MPARHVPVLLDEVVDHLQPQPNQHFIDGTIGGGGHAKKVLEATTPDGRLLAIDRDSGALAISKKNLAAFHDRVTYIQDSFANLKHIYHEQFSLYSINGILLDLGLSSSELEDSDRGFSFQLDSPLDMRFDTRQSLTAAEIINEWPADSLTKVFREYGNEVLAPEIIRALLALRQSKQKIKTTKQLVSVILSVYREKLHSQKEIPWIGGIHPATKIFQALRIAVNDELQQIHTALPDAVSLLTPGGRLAIISFHSLEDKIVKDFFKRESTDCICPPEIPICVCDHHATIKKITKKPTVPTKDEITKNPRARSAKLRVVEKI